MRLDENFGVQPALATDWKANDDGSVWTFNLRPNVKFHDGSAFTAKDVIFSFARLFDPKAPSPSAAWLSPIDPAAIKAPSDLVVEFHLKEAVVEFPELIAYSKILKDGQTADQVRTAGIGTGAFKVEKFVPGEEPAIFVKHDQYWQPGKPGVDRVEVHSVPGRGGAYRGLDLRPDRYLLGSAAARLGAAGARQERGAAIAAHGLLARHHRLDRHQAFRSPKVREALKLAANREQLLKAVLGGRGSLGNDSPVAPWIKFGLKDEPQRKQDIAQAKQLLAEAGYPDGIDLELYTSASGSGLVELATAYKAQAEAAGIRITINQAPAEDYWSNIWLKKPFIVTA